MCWLNHGEIYFYTFVNPHYNDVIMGAIASQITSLTIVYSTVYSDADQRKHQSSASLAFVRGIHRWPVNFPTQRASNAENVSTWRRHYDFSKMVPRSPGCIQWDCQCSWKWRLYKTCFYILHVHFVCFSPLQSRMSNCSHDSLSINVQHILAETKWPPFRRRHFKRISWMKILEFIFKNHWSLFLRFQLTIFKNWSRK